MIATVSIFFLVNIIDDKESQPTAASTNVPGHALFLFVSLL